MRAAALTAVPPTPPWLANVDWMLVFNGILALTAIFGIIFLWRQVSLALDQITLAREQFDEAKKQIASSAGDTAKMIETSSRQADDMRTLAELARDRADAAAVQGAFTREVIIKATRPWLVPDSFTTPPRTQFTEADKYVRIELRNTGLTPAFNLDVFGMSIYGSQMPDMPTDSAMGTLESEGGFVGAGKVTLLHVELMKFSDQEMANVVDGRANLYILAKILYDDIFGEHRSTTFSVVYVPEIHQWRVGNRHNELR